MRFLILLASACFALTAVAAAEKKIVCYLGAWAAYRTGDGTFESQKNIDASLCTHLIYSFVGVGGDSKLTSLDTWLDFADGGGKAAMKHFNALKNKNKNLKTLVAVGGWNVGSKTFSSMAAKPDTRKIFVESVVAFLKKHNFDGFDVDWEYPTEREGGSPADRANFIALLRDLKAALENKGLLLSAAVGAGANIAAKCYDIKEMNKYLDFINLMTYDFVTAHGGKLGMNAGQDSVVAAVDYWLKNGASKDKLILGTPMYGRTFTLTDTAKNTPGSPSTGGGTAGPITKEIGMLGYNEICKTLNAGGWKTKWDTTGQVPYAYKGNQWISYDDVESIKVKANYAKEMGLGGAMIWSIETDDFKGTCGEPYPLLKTLNHVLRGGKAVTNYKPPSPKLSPKNLSISNLLEDSNDVLSEEVPEQSSDPSNYDKLCQDAEENGGLLVNPDDSSHYLQCVRQSDGSFNAENMACPDTLVFDPQISVCNYP